MRKFEKILKKNFKLILGVVIGLVIGFTITLIVNVDTILFASSSVEYTPSNGLTSTTVQGAIDELYTKYINLECKSGFVKGTEDEDSYTCVTPPICKAVTHLPLVGDGTNNTWRNDLLKVTDTTNNAKYRAILADYQTTHNATSTSGGTSPTAFEYKNTTSNIANAARLITAQEIMRGCNLTQVGSYTPGEISECNFLFERTLYSKQESTWTTYGPWFETPRSSSSYNVWSGDAYSRDAYYRSAVSMDGGVRPTIDVAKSKLSA